jgi:hypothetical protein
VFEFKDRKLVTQSRLLTCYYFHGQDFCIVPRHVRADVTWMADHGVDAVAIAVHEGDLYGSNLPLVCDEAKRAGLKVLAVPSRVAGLVAGWHRAPGYISTWHPELWGRDANGRPLEAYGPQASLHHPDLHGHLTQYLDTMFDQLPLDGLIWDEIKTLHWEDHSQAAIAALGRPATIQDQLQATTRFFSGLNRHLHARRPELRIDTFVPTCVSDEAIQACAAIEGLTAFGCDGKCWPANTCDVGEGGADKHLIGNVERFRDAANANGTQLLTLLELQMLSRPALELTCKHLPDLLAYDPEHLIYYYYPRLMEDAEEFMPRIGQTLARWKQSLTAQV